MIAQELANKIANALKGGQELNLIKIINTDGEEEIIDPNASLNESAAKIAKAIIDYVANPEGGSISSVAIPQSPTPTPTGTRTQATNLVL
jgi:hypothetical protein